MFGFLLGSIPGLLKWAPVEQMKQLNEQLGRKGLPPIMLNSPYNKHYRTSNTPRVLVSWSGLRLQQVYLEFLVNQKEDPQLFEQVRSSLTPDSPWIFFNSQDGVLAMQIQMPVTIHF